jgi:hypothetical protein
LEASLLHSPQEGNGDGRINVPNFLDND